MPATPAASAGAPERPVDPADLTKLRQVLAADPTLDDDLSEWNSDVVSRPRVAILGPAQITAPGETPKRHKWFTEVGVYLALHRKGVNLEKFAADLWPLDGKPGQARAIATSTRNETASKVRKWMGTHPDTGVPFVPMGTDKYYRLDGRLLDVELFQRLRERGDAKAAAGDPTAIDDYVAALNIGPRPHPSGGLRNGLALAGQRRPPGRPQGPRVGGGRRAPRRAGRRVGEATALDDVHAQCGQKVPTHEVRDREVWCSVHTWRRRRWRRADGLAGAWERVLRCACPRLLRVSGK